MDTAPENDPLRKFLSGKRRAERRTCDLAVEVRGTGTTFTGRAIDVSEGGVMIWLDDKSIEAVHPGMSMIEALGLVDRYFRHGAQVVFPAESLRVPSSIVRLTPPRDGRGIYLGCRFERELTPDEAARLLAAKLPPPIEPLALAPRKGDEIYLFLFPGSAVAAGPRFIARLLGLGGAELDARIEPPRPTPADEVRSELSTGSLTARAICAGATLWEGALKVVSVRPGISRTPAVDVRVSASAKFPPALVKRFEKRRR